MCGYCTGMKRLDGMKWSLFPAFIVWLVWWEKAGAGEMELGLKIAECKVRNHSCRGVKSGLWAERAVWATSSGEGRTGLGSEKASEANVPDDLGRRNYHIAIFQTLKVENLNNTGSVTKSGKVNAGMECRELNFKPAWITLPYWIEACSRPGGAKARTGRRTN